MIFDCVNKEDLVADDKGTLKSNKTIRERRADLIRILRKIRSKQIKASKRFKIRTRQQFDELITKLKNDNEEGFVLKRGDQKFQLNPDIRTFDPTQKHKFEYTGKYRIVDWEPMISEDPDRANNLIGSVTIEIPNYGVMNANIGNGFDFRRELRTMANNNELIGKYAVVSWYGKSTSASTIAVPRAPLTMYDISDIAESRANLICQLIFNN